MTSQCSRDILMTLEHSNVDLLERGTLLALHEPELALFWHFMALLGTALREGGSLEFGTAYNIAVTWPKNL